MGRKPRIQSRSRRVPKAPRPKRLIYQCLRCGALPDPMYGTGEYSWCPFCRTEGNVYIGEGEIPYPALYGGWLERQKTAAAADGTPPKAGETQKPALAPLSKTSIPLSTYRGSNMQVTQYHSGLYHCPACCMEFELYSEAALKCGQCGGRLEKGSLDDDPDEDEDEDE
ncbi:MAG TPA: hypothetical protein VNF46_06950 [Gammaproteobacteria bacterium]|nr:hypothetical protein [Gammaproteobacteria bacterium]